MTHTLRHQDSLNSSGTISRKTSTASDYTPEHTLFPDAKIGPPDTSANDSEQQEFLVAEIGSSQDNSESKIEMSDAELSSGRDMSNTSISTISGECTVRRDSQPQINGNDTEKYLSRQDTTENYEENIPLNGTYSEPILQNTTGLTYAEVTKSPKKESGLQFDDDYISVTSSQYTDTITSLSDVTSGHSSGSESKVAQKIELKICLLQNENKTEVPNEEIQSEMKENTPLASPQKTAEKTEVETKLKVPQRKISRFLVSPVLDKLDLPKDKNYGSEISETAPENQQNETQEQVTVITQETQAATQENLEIIDTSQPDQKLESEGPVCGPEMINTLEQLKISLQNITHAQLATTVAQPATPQPVITQPKPQQKPSMVGDPPNPSQLFPNQDMLLTIDTQTTSNVPTPIITPTLQRQMSHSSTEPQLSTSAGFPSDTVNYQQQQFVQQPAVVLQNQSTIQQPVVHQQAMIQQQPTVLQQSMVNDGYVQPVLQTVPQDMGQGFVDSGINSEQYLNVVESSVQSVYQPVEQPNQFTQVEGSEVCSDLPIEGGDSSGLPVSPER